MECKPRKVKFVLIGLTMCPLVMDLHACDYFMMLCISIKIAVGNLMSS